MAAKNKIVYICSNCGFESAKWAGKCPDCGEWNTMEESVKTAVSAKSAASGYSSSASTLLTRPLAISEIDTEDEHRYHTGLSELDRVLGGGLVKGSLVLISGDPGIGKSTILCRSANTSGKSCVFYMFPAKNLHGKSSCAQGVSVFPAPTCAFWRKRTCSSWWSTFAPKNRIS